MKDWSDALAHWPIEGPSIVEPALTGGNNSSHPVVTRESRYFLRVYQNTTDPARVLYEHSILTLLQRQSLSFAVPAPIPARDGSTLLSTQADTASVLVALFPVLPGEHPDGADLSRYRVCGNALAELDRALSRISVATPPGILPPFGDLSLIHPQVPDPLSMVEQLPIEPRQRSELARLLEDMQVVTPAMYETLPRQIVHRDVNSSNVLMVGNTVTGVLDFEFAGPDLRAFDLARSLTQFTGSPWSIPDGWDRLVAFASGYGERIRLTEGEIQALPDLMRLYRVGSLVHREGRRRQGLATHEDVVARAHALLNADTWVKRHHQNLLDVVGTR